MTSRSISRTEPRNARQIRAITYERISDDATGEEAGVGRQSKDNKGYCAHRRWTIVADFVDNDISASRYSSKKRPGYAEAIRMLRDGEADALVAYHLDRLWRKPAELEELIDLVEQRGIIVATLNGEFDLMTGEGRLQARMLVAVAAMESDNLSRRIRRKRAELRDQGLPGGGLTPYGWTDHMTPNPAEAANIVAAVDAVLRGESLTGIARRWNAAGVPTRKNCKNGWTSHTVRDVVINPRHAGLMVHGRRESVNGKTKYVREVVGDGAWPAIIDRATHERVCAVVAVRGSRTAGVPRRRSLLTGLVRCGRCGTLMVRHGRAPRNVWCCSKLIGFTPDACASVAITAPLLEEYVSRVVFAVVGDLDLAALLADSGDDDTAAALELADLERRVDEAGVLFSRKQISARAFAAASADLEAQQQALRARLTRSKRVSVLATYAGRPGVLDEAWPNLTDDQRRAIVVAAVGEIRVDPFPGGARFRFRTDRIHFAKLEDPKETG
jgi:DNA invertase Pin-like site-specific DNA recombinase